MSPHTDVGALLPVTMLVDATIKLNELLDKYWMGDNSKSNIIAMCAAQLECKQALDTVARQAASHGRAGGEQSEVRSEVVAWQKRRNDYARGEWIQVLPEHVDEAKSRGWQVRPLYAAPQPAIAAQARQERHEATYLRGWNEGIECAVEALEKEGWYTPQDTIRKLVEASPVPSAERK